MAWRTVTDWRRGLTDHQAVCIPPIAGAPLPRPGHARLPGNTQTHTDHAPRLSLHPLLRVLVRRRISCPPMRVLMCEGVSLGALRSGRARGVVLVSAFPFGLSSPPRIVAGLWQDPRGDCPCTDYFRARESIGPLLNCSAYVSKTRIACDVVSPASLRHATNRWRS